MEGSFYLGQSKESIEEIRFNAPRAFSAGDRAVTANDYKAIIESDIENVDSISVWGGQDNTPPVYGKVFVSLKPRQGFTLTAATKDQLVTKIKQKHVLSVVTEFVDPDFTFVGLEIDILYNNKTSKLSSAVLQSLARNTAIDYFDKELDKFDRNFYFSRFVAQLDNIDPSIVSSAVNVKLQKRIRPAINVRIVEDISFNNPVTPNEFSSTNFFTIINGSPILVYLKDIPNQNPADKNGNGVIQLLDVASNNVLISDAGSINYKTGELSLRNFIVFGYTEDQFQIRLNAQVQEDSANLYVRLNQILTLDDSTPDLLANIKSGLIVNVIPQSV